MASTISATIAGDVLCCVDSALKDSDRGAPERRYVTVGAIAYDDISCESGQTVVSVENVFHSGTFPQQQLVAEDEKCGTWLCVALVVSVLRCAPTQGDRGEPPSAERMDDWSEGVLEDEDEIRCAIRHCIDGRPLLRLAMGATTMNGPDGGGLAVEVRCVVAYPAEC